ncbi:hypothetical protein A0H81_14751 [Grifola frondosa]|uniref:Uncharacterized protein n=1 Tax=Grifola frondosa TaxID=5627 RepID=A0A1C7LM35_GRIFR|nr:hypothetical protein A0H81_14751 [Grifola frondosa]
MHSLSLPFALRFHQGGQGNLRGEAQRRLDVERMNMIVDATALTKETPINWDSFYALDETCWQAALIRIFERLAQGPLTIVEGIFTGTDIVLFAAM